MYNRPYREDDFRNYDVVKWYGAERKELVQSASFEGYKGEVLALDAEGKAVKATAASPRVFFQWNIMVGVPLTGWDAKASGTVTAIAGAHEADTLLYDTAATFAINSELTVKTITVEGKDYAGLGLAASGDMVIAVVDALPAANRGALRIKVLDHPYAKA
jgi:hypothetical protein